LALWSAVATIGCQGLGEYRGACFDLWGSLFSGWQGESVGCQNREGQAKQ